MQDEPVNILSHIATHGIHIRQSNSLEPKQLLSLSVLVLYISSTFLDQVSRCEKFGYGVMVTQVAATAPGIVALRSSGKLHREQIL